MASMRLRERIIIQTLTRAVSMSSEAMTQSHCQKSASVMSTEMMEPGSDIVAC